MSSGWRRIGYLVLPAMLPRCRHRGVAKYMFIIIAAICQRYKLQQASTRERRGDWLLGGERVGAYNGKQVGTATATVCVIHQKQTKVVRQPIDPTAGEPCRTLPSACAVPSLAPDQRSGSYRDYISNLPGRLAEILRELSGSRLFAAEHLPAIAKQLTTF